MRTGSQSISRASMHVTEDCGITLGVPTTYFVDKTGSVLDDPYSSAADRKTAAERPPLTSVLTLDPFYLPAELFSDADQRSGALSPACAVPVLLPPPRASRALMVRLWRSVPVRRVLRGAGMVLCGLPYAKRVSCWANTGCVHVQGLGKSGIITELRARCICWQHSRRRCVQWTALCLLCQL